MKRRSTQTFLFLLGIVLGLIAQGPKAEARDPKSDEIPVLQEIAAYLSGNTDLVYNNLRAVAGNRPQVDWALPLLEKLNQRAVEFHERLRWNTKSPWRTTNAYEDLSQAFNEAREVFVQRSTYSINPPAFEEIAYLMDLLLTYYLYPTDQGPIYSTVIGPPVVYSWVPPFYTYSTCRRFPFYKGPRTVYKYR